MVQKQHVRREDNIDIIIFIDNDSNGTVKICFLEKKTEVYSIDT